MLPTQLFDTSLFNGTVAAPSTDGPQQWTWHPVRGLFDTGAKAPKINLVSRDILKRMDMEPLLEEIGPDELSEVRGINGSSFQFTYKIRLTWQLNNSTRSFSTVFLLAEQGEFDLLLGNDFIKAHDALRTNKSFHFLGLPFRTSGDSAPSFFFAPGSC